MSPLLLTSHFKISLTATSLFALTEFSSSGDRQSLGRAIFKAIACD
ncbi:hypothetical protein [Fischerella sp. PCC 9605]|nr:hypothetical protein [Fischerella sp. PCC 9605]